MKITITPEYSLQVRAECVDFLHVDDDGVEVVLSCWPTPLTKTQTELVDRWVNINQANEAKGK